VVADSESLPTHKREAQGDDRETSHISTLVVVVIGCRSQASPLDGSDQWLEYTSLKNARVLTEKSSDK